ncbi:hypothetical protein ACFXJO_05770 [Streptomyces lavendulae]|uniref:hypothetical protein n=1 Tax=Streptomyces lavendulae TaxID=1914 RepID=UPI0036C489BB
MPSRFQFERAVRSSELAPLSRLLALTVATWADVRTGVIPDHLQPSLTTLEESTGLVRASVRTHLDKLEAGGWLKRNRPSVAAARAVKARTKYKLLIPKGAEVPDSDGIELGQDVTDARAGDALDERGLGQEMPQARAGDALPLGQEMTVTRAGDALSSYLGPNGPKDVQPPRAAADDLPTRMLTKWWEQYGRQTAQGRTSVRAAIAAALENGIDPNLLWQALVRVGELSKPITGGTLQFALSELRKNTTGADVIPLAGGRRLSTADQRASAAMALAAELAAEDNQ